MQPTNQLIHAIQAIQASLNHVLEIEICWNFANCNQTEVQKRPFEL